MTLVRTAVKSVIMFEGTTVEVGTALANGGIPLNNCQIFFNGTNVSAICKMK